MLSFLPHKNEIAKLLPNLSSVNAVAKGDDFDGSIILLSWTGEWEAKTNRFLCINSITAKKINCNSNVGKIILHDISPNYSDHNKVVGICRSIELIVNNSQHESGSIFRRFIKTNDKLTTNAFLSHHFSSAGNIILYDAFPPLCYNKHKANIFYDKDCKFIVLEINIETDTTQHREYTKKIADAVCMIFMYLKGIPMDADGCDAIYTAENKLISANWYKGREYRNHFYRPIPCSYAELYSAKKDLQLSEEITAIGACNPNVISKCLEKYIKYPTIATPMEYLARFPDAPLEMRGAFIAVALESLTDHLQKSGILDTVTLLPPETWDSLKTQLIDVVKANWDGWEDQQKNALVIRINNMNSATNSQKLNLPFDKLGIKISADEKKAIDKRNKLLHQGRILDPDAISSDQLAWKEAYMTEMRIYTAVNKLLLMCLGYTGPIIDWGNTSIETGNQKYILI